MEINSRNARSWSRMGQRAVYGLKMLEVVEENPDVYVLSGDLGRSSGLLRVMTTYPERFLNAGIAEQNLIGVSAGLAKEGLVPFASSFAPFITHRCADQVRMNMGYMHLNIKTVGLASGVSMSGHGNSHYGVDDLSFMQTIPGMVILSPCDCSQLIKCIDAAVAYEGPVYLRLTGEPGIPTVYAEDFELEIGKSITLREGEDVLIIATGSQVHTSLSAADILNEKGISAKVVDMHTIKPLDTSVLDGLSSKCKLVVTVEEHGVKGGMGSMVAQYAANKGGLPKILNIGLPEEYLKPGSYAYMLDKYGLTAEKIVEKIINNI